MRVRFLVFRPLNEKLKDFFLCALCVSSEAGGENHIQKPNYFLGNPSPLVAIIERWISDVPAPMVASTLIAYLAVYAALLAAYIGVLFYMATKAARGETVKTEDGPRSEAATVALVAGE